MLLFFNEVADWILFKYIVIIKKLSKNYQKNTCKNTKKSCIFVNGKDLSYKR